MTELAIAFDDDRTRYAPGELVRGRALWLLDEAPDRVEVRLFWHTAGKGDVDLEIVATVAIDAPGKAGDRRFELQLPILPWSFSGKLISLVWAVEIVALPDEQSQHFDIEVGPERREVRLGTTGERG